MNTETINNPTKHEFIDTKNNFEEIVVPRTAKSLRTDSYFDGTLLELIGWRVLTFLISIISLGVGSSWAKCMLYSYEINHTVYNGKRLKFEGDGGDLYVNMFKWRFFSIITLGIYLLFVPAKKANWVISNIHFEDEPFVRNESFFYGKPIHLFGVNILCFMLNCISLGLLYPFTSCYKLRWINKHTIINRKKLVFTGNGLSLFGKYLLWYFLSAITIGIYGLWLPINLLKWKSKNTHIKTIGELEEKNNITIITILIGLICILFAAFFIKIIITKLF